MRPPYWSLTLVRLSIAGISINQSNAIFRRDFDAVKTGGFRQRRGRAIVFDQADMLGQSSSGRGTFVIFLFHPMDNRRAPLLLIAEGATGNSAIMKSL